jgi:DNA adenine methylase Dam
MKNPNWRKCLLNGDSKTIIKKIPDNSIDFILTDPPYNLGQHSTGNIPLPGRSAMNNDVADWDHVDFNPEEWADEFIRILKPSGNLFIFTSYNQLGRWYNCLDNRFDTSNFMIWHKTNPAPKIFKAGFLNSCEMIFTCWNKKHTWNFISQAEMHNFIESSICMRPERLAEPKHPAQKPVKILEKLIRIASNENDIIFDPFMGVGSTGVAAMNLNRKFIGIEIDKKYFEASERRIDVALRDAIYNNNDIFKFGSSNVFAQEPNSIYEKDMTKEQLNIFSALPEWAEMLPNEQMQRETKKPIEVLNKRKVHIKRKDGRLKPLLKWPGGKEKELKFIIPEAPKFNNYYEPFVGGGSVFTAFNSNHFFINDKSEELINLYSYISTNDANFYSWAEAIDTSWKKMLDFSEKEINLKKIYLELREGRITNEELLALLIQHLNKEKKLVGECLDVRFVWRREDFFTMLLTNLKHKLLRMKKIELERTIMPEGDIMENIETGYMATLYTYFRSLYNDKQIFVDNVPLHTALFLYLRYNAYSGMFRYNDNGEFNVPYGGISYNHKTLEKELDYYHSEELHNHFEKTTIENLDFEEFFHLHQPKENDFIFLDPPYDSEFSTYAQNDFTRNDQNRLANYLINECRGKWMMIIKATSFILSLYENKGLTIKTFDKTYQVSFMNRNDKDVQHLIIMNY